MASQQEAAGNGSPRLGGSGTSVLGRAQEQVGHSPEQAGLTWLEQKVGLETSLDPLQPELSRGLVVWAFQCPRKRHGRLWGRQPRGEPPAHPLGVVRTRSAFLRCPGLSWACTARGAKDPQQTCKSLIQQQEILLGRVRGEEIQAEKREGDVASQLGEVGTAAGLGAAVSRQGWVSNSSTRWTRALPFPSAHLQASDFAT